MLWRQRLSLAQQILFGSLVFLIPSQLGLHIWLPSSYLFGIRVDYFAPTLYLTDLLVAAILALFIVQKLISRKPLFGKRDNFYLSLFLAFGLFNVIFAVSGQLALIKFVKILELALLCLYVKNQTELKLARVFFLPLILSGIFFGLVGMAQFIYQKSLGGFFYFLGERSFNSLTPGIALGDFFGFFGLRAYSTFSHPNSFAGFLGFLLVGIYFFQPGKERLGAIRMISLILGLVSLYLTLSRWVFISLIIVFLILFLGKRKFFDIGRAVSWLLGLLVVASLLLPIFANELLSSKIPLSETFSERLYLAKRAGEIVTERPTFGVGLNNYISSLPRASAPEFSWRLQPVHNIFLLIFVEGGAVGLLGLTFIFWKALQNSSKYSLPESNKALAFWVILFVIITGLGDHYWLTLQQNQLILSLILGIAARKS